MLHLISTLTLIFTLHSTPTYTVCVSTPELTECATTNATMVVDRQTDNEGQLIKAIGWTNNQSEFSQARSIIIDMYKSEYSLKMANKFN